MARFVTILALFMALASSAGASVIEVPVPGLHGTYSQESRSVVVTLPSKPSVIHSVSVRVHGTGTGQDYLCVWNNPPEPERVLPLLEFMFVDGAGGWDSSSPTPVEGTIAWTRAFTPFLGATWDFLLDGTAVLDLMESTINPIPECLAQSPPGVVTLDEVTLIVDADFPTPTRNATWGHIKSIYR